MSILQYPDAINEENMQVWNNAAFDDASSQDRLVSGGTRLRTISINSISSDKENHIPVLPTKEESKTLKTHHLPLKPPMKVHFKIGVDDQPDDHRTIDSEIEEIEKEIKRLSSRLEDLRLKKQERELKVAMEARRGRIVAARFMDSRHTSNKKKMEETPARDKFRRRGLSLGPLEITPLKTPKSRRMSCIQRNHPINKEEEEEEEAVLSKKPTALLSSSASKNTNVDIKRRGPSLGPLEIAKASQREKKVPTAKKVGRRQSVSVSPKSRKSIPKFSELRKGVETVGGGTKKAVRKDGGAPTSLQPKSLFHDEDGKKASAAASKRSMKGRPVSSRYTTTITQAPESKRRKWSLPYGGPLAMSASSEESPEETKPPAYVSLPKIRTSGACVSGCRKSPRDSGAVKRAVEVIGRRSHFGGMMESTCCQNLSFEEELELHDPSSVSSEDE